MQNQSYWIISSKGKSYPHLEKNIDTECAIIGGGIVGVTTAYLLAKGGANVSLFEADKIGYGSSGRNTGKVSTQHDIIYSKIDDKYGFETAFLYHEINEKALNLIEKIIIENNIECNFEKMSSFIYTENENYIEDLKKEYEICKKIGIKCEYHETLDLPLEIKGAISFKNQGQFNPKKYIDGLLQECIKLGVEVYENTPIIDIEKGDICKLISKNKNTINAKNVVIASHVPWYDGFNFYFAKQKGDRSYLLGYDLKNKFEKGMFLNIEDPSRTFRTYEG
ncbi:MAG: NAD(P)/FAD-dependent oxidoreductase, partial [Peptostreptococcaceae bacterium]